MPAPKANPQPWDEEERSPDGSLMVRWRHECGPCNVTYPSPEVLDAATLTPLLDVPNISSFTGRVTWLDAPRFQIHLDHWYGPGVVDLEVDSRARTFRWAAGTESPAGDWHSLDQLAELFEAEVERQRAAAPAVPRPPPLPMEMTGAAKAMALLFLLLLGALFVAVIVAAWPG